MCELPEVQRQAADTIEALSAKLAEENLKRSGRYDSDGWIPVEERLPEEGKYVLISFDNFPLADIGRYETDQEDGVFYPGDEEKSYISYGLFVNAWQPLPEPYKERE